MKQPNRRRKRRRRRGRKKKKKKAQKRRRKKKKTWKRRRKWMPKPTGSSSPLGRIVSCTTGTAHNFPAQPPPPRSLGAPGLAMPPGSTSRASGLRPHLVGRLSS
jgi:hypothetical protein